MADYGIFGHGSSGNSWFANKLDDFHASTKKYDPLGHYAVEWPMKGAHWLVEKSSKGLADAGIGEGFNRRLSSEADENGNNFGLGSQRMGLGILSVLGGMYGLSGEAAGAAGSGAGGGGAAAGGAPTALGYGLGGTAGYTLPGSGGAAAGGAAGGLGSGLYMEQGGGMVADSGGGGFNWLNADGTSGSTGLLGQGGSSGGLMQQLMQQGGSGGQQQAQGQQGSGRPGGTMLGNPALTAALAKLVEDDAKAKREQQGGPLQDTQQEQGGIFGLTADDIQRLLAMYQQQQDGGGYGGVA